MTGRHPGRHGRLLACGAALLTGLLLLGLVGCGEKTKSFTYDPPPETTSLPWLLDIWGSGPDDIYIVGRPGVLLHWNGTEWALQSLGTSETLTAVWGTGPTDVFVVGHKGLVYHFNGSGWSQMGSGTSRNRLLRRRGPGNAIYIAAKRRSLFRLDGGNWVATPDTAMLYNAAGTAPEDTLLRSRFQIVALTSVTPYAISGSDGVALMTDTKPTRWRRGHIDSGDWINTGWGGANIPDNWLASDTGRLYRTATGAVVARGEQPLHHRRGRHVGHTRRVDLLLRDPRRGHRAAQRGRHEHGARLRRRLLALRHLGQRCR